MFFFGSHEDTAQVYWENLTKKMGPNLAEGHYEEMSLEDLRNTFTFLYITYKAMLDDEVEQGVIDAILPEYDAVFELMGQSDDRFKEAVGTGRHQFLPDRKEETVNKYRGLAGLPLES